MGCLVGVTKAPPRSPCWHGACAPSMARGVQLGNLYLSDESPDSDTRDDTDDSLETRSSPLRHAERP